MPKLMINNKIAYQNVNGRVNQHDAWLNQSLLTSSSPTFGNIQLTGDATIEGNLYVEGNTTILDSNIIEFADNIIIVNNLETGNGITLNQGGIEINRGTEENFRMVYKESDSAFMVGIVSNLEPVAIRELNPLQHGILIWESTNKRIESSDEIYIPISFNASVNSTNLTTGSIITNGGLAVKQDQYIGGTIYLMGSQNSYSSIDANTNGNLIVSSVSDILLVPNNTVNIPYAKSISFGQTSQSVSSDLSNNLSINAEGNINLTSDSVIIPNQVPLIFNNSTEKIVSDINSNMNITSSQDINLSPATNKKVLIPNNVKLAFNNTEQSISSDTTNLLLHAANNIELSVSTGSIKINNSLSMENHYINNVLTPQLENDAATKGYVDLVKQGLYVKDSVEVATTTIGNLSTSFNAGDTVDGYTLQVDDRILIKDQLDPIENGIYVITVGTPTRASDLPIGVEAAGVFVFVKSGDLNASFGFICNSSLTADIVGTDSLNFTQFTGIGLLVAGDGLTRVLNEIYVNVDNSSLEIISDTLRIKSSAVSTGLTGGSGFPLETSGDQSHVTKLGVINTGTWQSDTINVSYGGTGKTFFSSGTLVFGNGGTSLNNNLDLFFDSSNTRLGVGTSAPSTDLHIKNPSNSILRIESNTSNPEIQLTTNGTTGILAITKNNNEYATDSITETLIISKESGVQFASNNRVQMSILNDRIYILNTSPSNNSSSGSLILNGGMSIKSSQNSSSSTNGGSLTLEGGFAVNKDVYIGGELNVSTANMTDLVLNVENGGIYFQRSQTDNNSGSGVVVNDAFFISDTLPDQALVVDLDKIKFSNSTNSTDDFYNGWWLKMVGGLNPDQVRQIIDYNGSQRVATLSSPFTTSNTIGNIVNLYNRSFVVNYFDEETDSFKLNYTNTTSTTSNNGYTNLTLNKLYSVDTTVSTNASTGSIYLLGSIAISNTNDAVSATEGGTFTTLGGVGIRKTLLVGDQLGICNTILDPTDSLHIKQTVSSIRLESDSSYLDFGSGSGVRFGLELENNLFSLTNETNNSLTITSMGNIGINTTTNINSVLTLNSNNYISTNNTIGFLGILSGSTTEGSKIILNSNGANGSLNLYASTTGSINMYSNNVKGLELNSSGKVSIYSTIPSSNSTSGALFVGGGVSIGGSVNSVNVSNGGSLTVDGGAAIQKDLYLGGNLYVSGIISSEAISTPSISISNTVNCSSTLDNAKLITINDSGILTFSLECTPILASQNCELQFTLPSKISNLASRNEISIFVSGYTDDVNLIPIFNNIGVGVSGTTGGLIKFQSISTDIHYLQVQASYTF